MKAKKIWLISKATGEAFTLGAGVTGIILSIIATFISVPLIIMFPTIGVMGIIFAGAGIYYAIKDLNKNELNKQDKKLDHDNHLHGEKYKLSSTNKIKHHFSKWKKKLSKQKSTHSTSNTDTPTAFFTVILQPLDTYLQTKNNEIDIKNNLQELNATMSNERFEDKKPDQIENTFQVSPNNH